MTASYDHHMSGNGTAYAQFNANGAISQGSSPSSTRPDSPPAERDGVLTIRLGSARYLALPPQLPIAIQQAIASTQGQKAASVTPSSILEDRLKKYQDTNTGGDRRPNRESLQRKQCWWLPYVVLGFESNEIMVEALGGDIMEPVWLYAAHFDVSRNSAVSAVVYLRDSSVMPSPDISNAMDVSDIYLGSVMIYPDFDSPTNPQSWFQLQGVPTGEIKIQVEYVPFRQKRPLSMESFELMKVVGKGTFGKVMQVRKRDTSRIYAMKTIRKQTIASRNEITHTLAERTVLAKLNNPFIVPLKFSFQTEHKLYLVLAFVNGGELFVHLQREGRFTEERSRFYAAELLCALEHLHSYKVIYRDLKPENILLDYTGHIALCDFGLCKVMTDNETTNTFCGTPEYLSPELLLGQGYKMTVDWWTLGTLLYEMMTGLPPYYHEDTNIMYQRILHDPLRFPDELGQEACSVIMGLLDRDASQRLGAHGAEEIKLHPFFSRHLDWERLAQKKLQPPFKPSVANALDTSNFDQIFTSEIPLDSVVDDHNLSETLQQQFAGFSYDGGHNATPHAQTMSSLVG